MNDHPTLVIDNGACNLRVGFSNSDKPTVFPNCSAFHKKMRRELFGADIDTVKDTSSLLYRRAFEKGFVVNWDREETVWRQVLGDAADPTECKLLVTEPLLTPDPLAKMSAEVLFEVFGFQGVCKKPAQTLALHDYVSRHPSSSLANSPCAMVLDCGFSATHAVPFFDGFPMNYAARQLEVGGKALTNYLKELLSFRQYDMAEETHLIDVVKRSTCFVSNNFISELAQCRILEKSPLRAYYALPSAATGRDGALLSNCSYLKPAEVAEKELLVMNSERISIPELLFRPSDIGIQQAGLAELIKQAVDQTLEPMHSPLLQNLLVVGGSSCFPGLIPRLQSEIRALFPRKFSKVEVTHSDRPEDAAWYGGAALAGQDNFLDECVTRSQYLENGRWRYAESAFSV